MNRDRLVPVALGLAAIALGLFLVRNSRIDIAPTPDLVENEKIVTERTNQIRSVAVPSSGLHPPITNQMLSEKTDETELTRAEEDYWNQRIDFFGKVVDEQSNPIQGATVSFVLQTLSNTPAGQALSDNSGLFSLTERTGKLLGVYVSKDGFYTSRREQTSFNYGSRSAPNYHKASPLEPVLFQLRRHGAKEPLVKGYVKAPLPLDGKPVRFDLNLGKISETGQLEIRSTLIDNDWGAVVSVRGGGLQETDDEFPFLAPENGYHSSLEYLSLSQKIGFERNFYVVSGQPRRFARIRFYLRNPQIFYMDYCVNPSGSRNLESDSGQ